jgi:hypothetical protein
LSTLTHWDMISYLRLTKTRCKSHHEIARASEPSIIIFQTKFLAKINKNEVKGCCIKKVFSSKLFLSNAATQNFEEKNCGTLKVC